MQLHWFVDGARPGAANMLRDRDLLARAEQDPRLDPVLRLYAWRPPAVSLGFHQSDEVLDPVALREHGFDVVRRPTGGAAVLHHEEITYSVSGALGTPGLGRSVLGIHDGIAAALRDALIAVGVRARTGGDGRPIGFACFGAAGGHEITVDGRKLVGSALRRTRRAFLQHGSILVGEGHLLLPRLQRDRDVASIEREVEELRARTCTLRALGAAHVEAGALGEEFAARLAHGLGAQARRVEDPAVFGIREAQDDLRN